MQATVRSWVNVKHPRLGTQTRVVEVRAGRRAEIRVVLQAAAEEPSAASVVTVAPALGRARAAEPAASTPAAAPAPELERPRVHARSPSSTSQPAP